MLPIIFLGGAALAALFLEGCGSSNSDTAPNNSSNTEPSSTPPPSDSASAAPSASASSAPSASSSASVSPPPLSFTLAAQFDLLPCEKVESFNSAFIPSFVDQEKFKDMIKGGAFCVRSPIDLPQESCRSATRSFSLLADSSAMQKILQFRVQGGPVKDGSCSSLLDLKEYDCLPNLGVNDLSSCDERPLFRNLFLLNNQISLANLLSGDGNGDGTKDLLIQLSNGAGVYLTQIPPCPPEGCNYENVEPE